MVPLKPSVSLGSVSCFRKERCSVRASRKDEGRDQSPPEHKEWRPAGDPVVDVFSYLTQRDGDLWRRVGEKMGSWCLFGSLSVCH